MNRDTICVQGGYTPGNGEPCQIPIVQSTTFNMPPAKTWASCSIWKLTATSIPVCRTPHCDLVAKKICELEGGTAAMLTSSGQAANSLPVQPLRSRRPHRGIQYHLRQHLQSDLRHHHEEDGIDATFVYPLCTGRKN